jgi:HEAT repeat protein
MRYSIPDRLWGVMLMAAIAPLGLPVSAGPPRASKVEHEQLRSASPSVRLGAAMELVKEDDVEAIAVLIDLLVDLPAAQRPPVEAVLQKLAGAWAPNLSLAGEDDISRGIRRDAWASWWRRTEGPLLLEEFRKRTLTAAQRDHVQSLIRQLDDASFPVRDKALAALIAYGAPVVPLVRAAQLEGSLERQRRAHRCLETIAKAENRALPPVAARLLALRNPKGALETLLAYLPYTEDERLLAEVQRAVTVLGIRRSKADPALVRALDDPLPVRRGLAAEILAGSGDINLLPAVRKLLKDSDAQVRQCTALALVQAGDRSAVPVLVDLATDSPRSEAWQAEEVLKSLAGENAPAVEPGEDAASRKRYRALWQAWWREHGSAVDLSRAKAGPTRTAKVRARASNSWDAYTPDRAFAGDMMWNAGDYAPQWIEADLGTSTPLARIQLTVNQLPAGDTRHEIWISFEPIGENRAGAKMVHTFTGVTDAGHQLKFEFPKDTLARCIQIRTTESPSWVAWEKIELRVGRSRAGFVKD